MQFDEYSHMAASTAIYPEKDSGSLLALTYLALGLGETGEVQGKLKKAIRDHGGRVTFDRAEALLAELGDVLWYVDRLAYELGSTLTDVAINNLAKLNARRDSGTLGGDGDIR